MKLTFSSIRIFLFVGVLAFAGFKSVAQKLPNKQEGSVLAPPKVKIDGKTTEWDFKAYNNATDVFYTIAHDDENIYLAIKATDETIVRKILSGGITFVINAIGKKSDENAATIRFPLFNFKNKPNIKFSLRAVPADSVNYFMSANNKNFASKGKFLRTTGITGVDTLLSVYNTDGISLASSFDNELHYMYELSVARKLIKDAINGEGRFYYKILLNPITMDDTPGVTINREENGNIKSVYINKTNMPPNPNPSMSVLTGVSGEYSLK
ncbi:hypothetical protein [Mucilaginibacter sp. HD30]